jgi:exodeoxyribonuclease-3
MKIISWNVNGIRAAQKKGFLDWIDKRQPDVLCIQETKAHVEQLDDELINIPSYQSDWFSGVRKGYSSVATYSKPEVL